MQALEIIFTIINNRKSKPQSIKGIEASVRISKQRVVYILSIFFHPDSDLVQITQSYRTFSVLDRHEGALSFEGLQHVSKALACSCNIGVNTCPVRFSLLFAGLQRIPQGEVVLRGCMAFFEAPEVLSHKVLERKQRDSTAFVQRCQTFHFPVSSAVPLRKMSASILPLCIGAGRICISDISLQFRK